jgi:hypothetical protein
VCLGWSCSWIVVSLPLLSPRYHRYFSLSRLSFHFALPFRHLRFYSAICVSFPPSSRFSRSHRVISALVACSTLPALYFSSHQFILVLVAVSLASSISSSRRSVFVFVVFFLCRIRCRCSVHLFNPLCLVLRLLRPPLRSLTLFSFPGFRFLRSVLQIRRRWLRLFPSPFFIAFFVFFVFSVFSAVPIFLRCVRRLRLSRLICFGSPRRLCRAFVLVSVSGTRPRLCHRRWVPLPCTSSSRWVCLFFPCVGLVHGISRFLHLGRYVFFALRWATETYVFSVVLNFCIQFFWRMCGDRPALFSSFKLSRV